MQFKHDNFQSVRNNRLLFIVLIFFMELRKARALVRSFAAAGFFWLLIMIALTSADYFHRADARAPIDRIGAIF